MNEQADERTGMGMGAETDRLAAARRAFLAALSELEAAAALRGPARGADDGAAERVEALEDRIAELEAERARLAAELDALRAAREQDAAMIEDALTELRAVV